MNDPLPWDEIQNEIEHAILHGFPDRTILPNRAIAEYMIENERYKYFRIHHQHACIRITTAVRMAGWKQWNHGARGSPTWLIPESLRKKYK